MTKNYNLNLGQHLTVDFYGCRTGVLLSESKLENIINNAAIKAGATIVSSHFHRFHPQGASGVLIIAESHITIHTWPEHDFAAVDIFTCGESINFEIAIDEIKKGLFAEFAKLTGNFQRGNLISQPEANQGFSPSWKEKFMSQNAWGLLSSIDLYDCNPEIIRNKEKIKLFVIELCEKVEMKRYGECQVVHFGEEERIAGFSMTQLIETSLISAHFANLTNAVYLDVFSCKFYEPRVVAEFANEFFEADNFKLNINTRL